MLDIAHPKREDTFQLPLMSDFATDSASAKRPPDDFKQSSLFDP
jgi:hypothetical protein